MKVNKARATLKTGGTCIGTMIRELRSPQVVQVMRYKNTDAEARATLPFPSANG
jgi:hypothetical protein